MITQPLQRLSVRDCFAQFAWQGQTAVAALTPVQTRQTTWQTTAVEDFFGQYNWSGRSAPALENGTPNNVTVFSVRLPVQAFFACFSWAGKSSIAQPAIIQPAPKPNRRRSGSSTSETDELRSIAAQPDFKLSNFSNLF
jgi:hypothetical protein